MEGIRNRLDDHSLQSPNNQISIIGEELCNTREQKSSCAKCMRATKGQLLDHNISFMFSFDLGDFSVSIRRKNQ